MRMLVIMSHKILEKQVMEVKEKMGVDNILEMPDELKNIWSNISPYGPLPVTSLEKIIKWIQDESQEGDYVLVQGDFGSTYYIVNYCFKKGRIPIYSTTARKVEEKVENGVVKTSRVFEHINFRKYQYYD